MNSSNSSVLDSPRQRQYDRFKAAHPDALLLWGFGIRFEAYGDDACTLARVLGPEFGEGKLRCAGFPAQELERHLRTLIAAGVRVAICEQVPDTPGVTPHEPGRAVTRVLTPGSKPKRERTESKPARVVVEDLFRTRRVAYVSVREARQALVPDHALAAGNDGADLPIFDFVVYESEHNYLVLCAPHNAKRRDGMLAWAELFGSPFVPVFLTVRANGALWWRDIDGNTIADPLRPEARPVPDSAPAWPPDDDADDEPAAAAPVGAGVQGTLFA
jgi:hypothetical protein